MIKDAALASWLSADLIEMLHHAPLGISLPWIGPVHVNWMAVAGAIFVVAVGLFIRGLRHKRALAAPLIIDPPGREEFPHRDPEKEKEKEKR
jgi:hypothetical protein